jgi:hypothetical protein
MFIIKNTVHEKKSMFWRAGGAFTHISRSKKVPKEFNQNTHGVKTVARPDLNWLGYFQTEATFKQRLLSNRGYFQTEAPRVNWATQHVSQLIFQVALIEGFDIN